MSGESCLVSIVVTTYNRANMLGDALRSLVALEVNGHFSYEILVIDDASTDYTGDVVEGIKCNSDVPIRYYIEDGTGVARARNRGIKEASGEWIAFFDDDQIAETCWLKELLAAAQKTKSLCVGGRVSLLLEGKKKVELPAFCRALLGETQHGNTLKQYPNKMLPGAGNILIHRRIFKAIGNFNELYVQGSEDAEFFRRTRGANFELWYAPKALLHHMTPPYRFTQDHLIWTSLRHGVSYAFCDYGEQGLLRVLFACILRLAQAVIVKTPHLIIALLRQNRKTALQDKCLIARAVGYFRETLFLISSKIFSQKNFYKKIRFRQERKIITNNSGTTGNP